MSKLEDKAFLRRTRATWLAGELDINFAHAHSILQKKRKATPKIKNQISKAVKKEMRASLNNGWGKRKSYY